MARTAIFIDGAYADYVLRGEFGGARVDFALLADALVADGELLRTYYYHCLPHQSSPPTDEEKQRFSRMQSFLSCLDRLSRFEVRLGKLARRGTDDDGRPVFIQKRVDIMLGVDLTLLSAKHQIATAVLVAGDSDFIPAIKIARNEGIVVHLYHGNRPHRELWDCCDERTPFSQELIDRCKLIPT